MDTFGFTKKKFEHLSIETRHKHILNWLSQFYQKLAANRVNASSLDLFTRQYNQILDWIGMNAFQRPNSLEIRPWMEVVSDQIQCHRKASGMKIRDHDLLENVRTQDRPVSEKSADYNCHIALDGVRSLFNVGSIFRTCEAAGFPSLLLGNTPGKEDRNVRKTAMGSHEWVAQEITTDLAATLMDKKEKGFTIVGIETVRGARVYNKMDWEEDTIVVFGNEEYGISSHVMAACDKFVHIPMFGNKNSINIANAVSVICFEMARCLGARKNHP